MKHGFRSMAVGGLLGAKENAAAHSGYAKRKIAPEIRIQIMP